MKNQATRLLAADLKIRLTLMGFYGMLILLAVYLSTSSVDASHHLGVGEKEYQNGVLVPCCGAEMELPAQDDFILDVLKARAEHPVFNILTVKPGVVHQGLDFRISSVQGKDIRMFIRKLILP